jgi:hypothetical protein
MGGAPRGFGVASAPRRSKPVQQLTQHAFDAPRFKTPERFGQAQTMRHCQLREVAGGRVIAMTILPGVERGPTIAYNPRAVAEAWKAVREIIAAVAASK